ncbi:hypothetical protein D3C83_127050 [compost metagenome]
MTTALEYDELDWARRKIEAPAMQDVAVHDYVVAGNEREVSIHGLQNAFAFHDVDALICL